MNPVQSPVRRFLSWGTFVVGMIAGIAGFAATFPRWAEDVQRRGYAETGCSFIETSQGWVVDELWWEELPSDEMSGCGRLEGAVVKAIDGKPIQSADDLFNTVYGSPTQEQHWTVVDGKGERTETVKLRSHPVVLEMGATGGSGNGFLFGVLEVFGAAAQTANILLSAVLFFFLRKRISVAPALTGALFAIALGTSFDVGFTPEWYQYVRPLAILIGTLGLGTAVVALPDGTIRSRGAAAFVGLWVLVMALCNLKFLPIYDSIPDMTAIAASTLFAGGGFLALLSRQRNCVSRREQISLRWVILGLLVPTITFAIGEIPGVPAILAEFMASVGFPLSTMVVPLAIVHGLHPLATYDLVRWVRFSTLVGMVLSAFALSLAMLHLIVTPILASLHVEEYLNVLAIFLLAAASAIAFYFRYRLVSLVDHLFFPMRIRAQRAVPESENNLGDCWSTVEIDWCVQRALKGGFAATGGRVVMEKDGEWQDLLDNSKVPLVLHPNELQTLKNGECVEIILRGDDGYATQLLPLRFRNTFLGILIAQPPEEARYTSWDQKRLQEIADITAKAVWRCTRVPQKIAVSNFATRGIMAQRE